MEENKTDKNATGQINFKLAVGLLAAFSAAVAGYLIYEIGATSDQAMFSFTNLVNGINSGQPLGDKVANETLKGIAKFADEQDFKNFLAEAALKSGGSGYGYGGGAMSADAIAPTANTSLKEESTGAAAAARDDSAAAARASETNVQVAGIDEPDLVKTDGKNIYYSPENQYYWSRGGQIVWDENGVGSGKTESVPMAPAGETDVIGAFPPDKLAKLSAVPLSGDLLLSGGTLAVFSNNLIYGYSVADPKSPKEIWKIRLEDNNELVDSRLYNGRIYLVSKTRIDTYHPCPIKPLSAGGTAMIIQCGDIYHPEANFAVDSIYNAMIINPATGSVEKTLSFTGSAGSSLVYMSEAAIYVTWPYSGDYTQFFYDFLVQKGADLVPDYVIGKIAKLAGYDISQQAKLMEIQTVIQNYRSSLNDDERLKFDNETQNRMVDFAKANRRNLERTGIVKIGLPDFSIAASGSVPGNPLNQFAFDEYKNHLRVAVTVDGGWGVLGSMGESANDIYVLDSALNQSGAVQDLALGERIYAARFVKELGYLVTFKQTDPFFIIDLSDPRKPEVKGELKIPGFSSYLHPISGNLVLGIGQEDWKVKISLFDVSLASQPKEIAKYGLNEYWTEIQNNHHAFLLDSKNQLFFVPGSKGGYVFSYKNNALELKKAVSGITAKRAVYLDDFLYIIGDDKIVVLSEQNFEKVNELALTRK